MNVSLVGMMGSGKSTIGRLIAGRTGMTFVDVDSIIEEETGMTVSEIFREFGQEEFRKFESEAVLELMEKDNLVISTGGGLPAEGRNMDNLRKMGPVIWLYASPEETLRRVGGTGARPLLDVHEPGKQIEALLEAREKHYRMADVKIDTTGRTPREVTDEALEFMEGP